RQPYERALEPDAIDNLQVLDVVPGLIDRFENRNTFGVAHIALRDKMQTFLNGQIAHLRVCARGLPHALYAAILVKLPTIERRLPPRRKLAPTNRAVIIFA